LTDNHAVLKNSLYSLSPFVSLARMLQLLLSSLS